VVLGFLLVLILLLALYAQCFHMFALASVEELSVAAQEVKAAAAAEKTEVVEHLNLP